MACFASFREVSNSLACGDPLDVVLSYIERGLAFVRETRFSDMDTVLLLQRHFVEYLRTPQPVFSGKPCCRNHCYRQHRRRHHAVLVLALSRHGALLPAGEYADAQAELEMAGRYAWSAPGHIHLLDYHLYSALALSMQLTPETFSAAHRQQHSRPLRQNRPLGAH